MDRCVVIRGAGDLASAVGLRLRKSGFNCLMCEIAKPTSIRRSVCFSECVYDGQMEIEGVRACLISGADQAHEVFARGEIAVIVDPAAECIKSFECVALVDAILAKRNTGTRRSMAPLTIGLGPGFTAGRDVHAVIETMRGHYLGIALYSGRAQENTGVPGEIMGFSSERVMRSPCAGVFDARREIGDVVARGDVIAMVGDQPVLAKISGVIRGMLRSGLEVSEGFKCADIDPRKDAVNYIRTVSDKARAISGSVLECVMARISQARQAKRTSVLRADSGLLAQASGVEASALADAAGMGPGDFDPSACADIYVDGSCNSDASIIGYGVVVIKDGKALEFAGQVEKPEYKEFRNIAGEIEASMFAMRYCLENGIGSVRLFFDYSGLRDWCTGAWRCKNILTRSYKAFYDSIKDRLAVRWMKVDAHTGNKFNELADKLAKRCFTSSSS